MDIVAEKMEFCSVVLMSLGVFVFMVIHCFKKWRDMELVLFLSFLVTMATTFLGLVVIMATNILHLSEASSCLLIGGVFLVSLMLIKKGIIIK